MKVVTVSKKTDKISADKYRPSSMSYFGPWHRSERRRGPRLLSVQVNGRESIGTVVEVPNQISFFAVLGYVVHPYIIYPDMWSRAACAYLSCCNCILLAKILRLTFLPTAAQASGFKPTKA